MSHLGRLGYYLPGLPRSDVSRAACWPPAWTIGQDPRRILFSRPWASHLAWARRPRFLQAGAQRRTVLFAGPWVGEFGWELMNWQAFIRILRSGYKRIIVCSRSSSEALYRGVCDEFLAHELRGQANSHILCNIENPQALQRLLEAIPPEYDHLPPLRFIPRQAQAFARLGDAAACANTPDVLIHARGRRDVPERNWSAGNWRQLVDSLQAAGYRVGSIGLSRDTLDIVNTKDYRDCPLAETLNRIAAAKLVVGPSSGPMHLASLCGTPHLVWTDRRRYNMRKTSRTLYETCWNPLSTPVSVLDAYGFNPPLPHVFSQTMRMLEDGKAFRSPEAAGVQDQS